MTSRFEFKPSPPPATAIAGTDTRFPVHRIFCVGKNYLAHAVEMGTTVDKPSQEPIYFQKHPCNLLASGSSMVYPSGTSDLHHEVELVVAVGKRGFRLTPDEAEDLIFGYACGLDMTRRDLQRKAKDSGGPWDLSKNFEQSAVLSPIARKQDVGMIESGRIELSVNGENRQSSDLSMMIWSVSEILVSLSTYYHLEPGDLIYMGTPEGVGPVVAGDVLHGSIDSVGEIHVSITD